MPKSTAFDANNIFCNEAPGRNQVVAWGGKCHSWVGGRQLFATSEKCFCNLICCPFFVVKERSPEIWIELHPDLRNMLESSVFSEHTFSI